MKPNLAQKQALICLTNSKKKKALVVLPSGAGKTILSAFYVQGIKGRVLYLVHRNEIIEQAIKEFELVHNISDSQIGKFNQYHKQIDRKFIFATIQTLSRPKNLELFSKNYFEVIISDEHHHSCANSYQVVLNYFMPKKLLGLTATPYRLDGKNVLETVKNNVAYEMNITEGIKKKLLVPFEYLGLWDNIDYSDIQYQGKTYTQKDLDKKLLIDKRDNQIILEFKNKLKKRKTIGFCCSINHCKRCVKKFNEAGIPSETINYETKIEDRNRIIEGFRQRLYQVIFTRDIFNEGVDFPEVEGLLFLRPTVSKTIFLQQLGRGLRKSEGKKNVIVLDFIGNYMNAYIIREIMKDIVETGASIEHKSVFKYNPICTIKFDSKVIKLFDEQVKDKRGATKPILINEYLRVKKELNRLPTGNDITQFGRFSVSTYQNAFGSWNKFKEEMNDYRHYSKGWVIEKYNFLKKKLERIPFTNDWLEHFGKDGLSARYRHFPKMISFAKKMGDYEEYKKQHGQAMKKAGKKKKRVKV